MFIKELKINNFKSFLGERPKIEFNCPDGRKGSGLNIFVGENNTGKSTVFEAIDFLRNNTRKDIEQIKSKNSNGEISVEVKFEGNVENMVDSFSQPNKVAVFKKYIYGNDIQSIKFSRATPEQKAIKLWDDSNLEFKNESGIDAPIKKLFEANFVWADTNPNDQINFGATTICGNLLKEIATGFKETPDYQSFSKAFHETFNSEHSQLRQALKTIEEKTQQIFKEQFGQANITFKFNEIDINSFFKNTNIDIDDGLKTPIEEKGSGMRRAVALAMLQVYAEQISKHHEDEELVKPFFLFIDEPEICLHPRAQKQLFKALLEISKTKQVFLATHSPYFISTNYLNRIGLFIFKSQVGVSEVEKISNGNKLLPWSPTWGEINYKAYDLPTVEFHNELYGRLQELSMKFKINEFETWLIDEGLSKTESWTMEYNGIPKPSQACTLQTFIRNKIHHPENVTMQQVKISETQLKQSIDKMIHILRCHS